MDLLYLIVNSHAKNMCFLCFKNEIKTSSIHSDIEIVGDCFNLVLSVANMMKKLFPFYDILSDQACNSCADLIIRMYITLYRYKMKTKMLYLIQERFNKELDRKKIAETDTKSISLYVNIHHDKEVKKVNKIDTRYVNTIKCKKCDMKLNSKSLLQEHYKSLHDNRNEAIVCDKCGHISPTPTSLKAHLNCHRQKECPYCFKILKTHSHYNVHIKNHELKVKRRKNKLYYNCNDCNYRSLCKSTLEAHINKIHLNVRPYICNTCSKGFHKRSHLTEHMSTHRQSKNETCEICGGHFANKRTLKEHQRLHTHTKPYACEICLKTFVTAGRRSDHIKRSHMEKAECCLICHRRFSLKKQLNRHIKAVHNENTLTIDNFESNIPSFRYDETVEEFMLPIG